MIYTGAEGAHPASLNWNSTNGNLIRSQSTGYGEHGASETQLLLTAGEPDYHHGQMRKL